MTGSRNRSNIQCINFTTAELHVAGESRSRKRDSHASPTRRHHTAPAAGCGDRSDRRRSAPPSAPKRSDHAFSVSVPAGPRSTARQLKVPKNHLAIPAVPITTAGSGPCQCTNQICPTTTKGNVMSTISHLRTRMATRRQQATMHRMLRNADPRVRAEVMAAAQRDQGWS